MLPDEPAAAFLLAQAAELLTCRLRVLTESCLTRNSPFSVGTSIEIQMSTRLGKELASRTSGGVRVTLRWRRDDDRIVIVVEDPVSEEIFELEARRDNA